MIDLNLNSIIILTDKELSDLRKGDVDLVNWEKFIETLNTQENLFKELLK